MKDDNLTVEKVKEFLSLDVENIDTNSIETSFEPVVSDNSVSIGVRYKGYCAEVARTLFVDMSHYYSALEYILSIIKVGESSKKIYDMANDHLRNAGILVDSPFLYSTGLLAIEQSFEDDFVLKKGVVFVVNLSVNNIHFSNTFILENGVEYITLNDSAKDYIENRPKFRDKSRAHELDLRRREHQRELLEKLIKEQLEYYTKDISVKEKEVNSNNSFVTYAKESQVPRIGEVVVDENKNAVVIPISDYAVPFHISTIKNVVVVDESVLKFNFNTEVKNIKNTTNISSNDKESDVADIEKLSGKKETMSTIIKSVNIPVSNARFVYDKIQALKDKYNAVKDGAVVEQDQIKLKQKKFGLEDLLYKTDFKTTTRKKKGCCLELHDNGFRYTEDKIDILFSNIRYIFYQKGDIHNRTLLHFNLYNPILVTNKKTKNVQFYREAGLVLSHNIQKRIDEHMDYMLEKEEEDRQNMINNEFSMFVEKIESETSLRVIIPTKGFTGVPNKVSTEFFYANECLIGLYDHPFFVLPLEEVEVVNFERVVYNVKTCDIIFILKNKTLQPVKILSVDTDKSSEIKDYLDSNNIVFMNTIFNINWKAVLKKIMEDPVAFYSSGGWSELMVEDKDTESEEEETETGSDDSTESTVDTSDDDTEFDTESESVADESEVSDEDESTYEEDSDESNDGKKKKMRR